MAYEDLTPEEKKKAHADSAGKWGAHSYANDPSEWDMERRKKYFIDTQYSGSSDAQKKRHLYNWQLGYNAAYKSNPPGSEGGGYSDGGGSRDYSGFFEGFEFPEYEGPSYEEMQAMNAQAAGENERGALYTEYMSSAEASADYINTEIQKERSNAALLGIDYNITDEQKQARVENYFGTVWGAGQQARLETLISEWGEPAGFGGFTLARGEGDSGDVETAEVAPVGKGRGMKVRPTQLDNSDTLGAGPLLGGV